MLYSLGCDTPFGNLVFYQRDGAILLLKFPEDNFFPDAQEQETPLLLEATRQLTEYFAGRRWEFTIPLEPEGTPFFKTIWKTMREGIPYGETRAYGEVGRMAGYPRHARGVGTANRQCPISILIPCHRVIAAGGKIGGYGGGERALDAKRFLLELEAANR